MGRNKVAIYQKIKVLTPLQLGYTHKNIRNIPGVSKGCISNIAEKQKLNLQLENRSGQGRKKLTTSKEDRHLIKLMKNDRRQTSRQLASEWSLSNRKVISARTVRRRLFNAGYKSYTTKRKPYRKSHHRYVRLKFACDHKKWIFNEWKNVIFSDESHFEVFNRKNRSFVRPLSSEANEPFNFKPHIQGGGGSISVWGVMTYKGVGSLIFFDGRLHGQNYINIIKPQLLPCIKKNFKQKDTYYYVQDNAPCHKSSFTMNWFKENKINTLDWPAISPDLNPIENLWDIIDKKLTNL